MSTNVRKVIPCKCGVQNTFNFDSDLDIEDLSITGKCPSCGSVVHVSISALLKPAPLQIGQPSAPSLPYSPPAQGLGGLDDADEKKSVEDALKGMF